MIDSKESLEEYALHWGLLPFFANGIRGLSVQEMTPPGLLFGDDDNGCWYWKGPVLQEKSLAYGKFFNRKAGFVSRELLPDFLNYRCHKYPVAEGSVESMVLDIVKEQEGVTSTELKKIIFGDRRTKRERFDLVDTTGSSAPRRKSLEGPLQRLQMGGHVLIADFEYKLTKKGDRYGWGVALYSTPEIWFERRDIRADRVPEESFERLVDFMTARLPRVKGEKIEGLIG